MYNIKFILDYRFGGVQIFRVCLNESLNFFRISFIILPVISTFTIFHSAHFLVNLTKFVRCVHLFNSHLFISLILWVVYFSIFISLISDLILVLYSGLLVCLLVNIAYTFVFLSSEKFPRKWGDFGEVIVPSEQLQGNPNGLVSVGNSMSSRFNIFN